MKTLLMTDSHQTSAPWSWPLEARAVTTVRIPRDPGHHSALMAGSIAP